MQVSRKVLFLFGHYDMMRSNRRGDEPYECNYGKKLNQEI